jgi:hypothetical protein
MTFSLSYFLESQKPTNDVRIVPPGGSLKLKRRA